jgi:hypothetical protein
VAKCGGGSAGRGLRALFLQQSQATLRCSQSAGAGGALTMSSSRSAVRLRARYRFSSADDSSPVSSLSCCNFCNSGMLQTNRGQRWCSARVAPTPGPGVERRHPPVHVPDLVVQGQERHWGVDGLTALGAQAHDLQPRRCCWVRTPARGCNGRHLSVAQGDSGCQDPSLPLPSLRQQGQLRHQQEHRDVQGTLTCPRPCWLCRPFGTDTSTTTQHL